MIYFGAKFKKLPVKIKAVLQDKIVKVANPWSSTGKLTVYPGDYLATNLGDRKQYPIQSKDLARRYVPVPNEPDIYTTNTAQPVIVEARLPKKSEKEIISCNATKEKTSLDGESGILIHAPGEPEYPVTPDYLLTYYEPVDSEARRLISRIRKKFRQDKLLS